MLVAAEAGGDEKTAVAGGQVNFGGQRHVAVLGRVVVPAETLVLFEIEPAVRRADVTRRTRQPGHRASQGQGVTEMPGEEHRYSLEFVEPGRVIATLVVQMRSGQKIQRVVAGIPLQRSERRLLKQHRATRIAQHDLFNLVATLPAAVDHFERGDALGKVADRGIDVVQLVG